MACGAAALASLLLPQAVVKRSAARSVPGKIRDDVLAKHRVILSLFVVLSEISQPAEEDFDELVDNQY